MKTAVTLLLFLIGLLASRGRASDELVIYEPGRLLEGWSISPVGTVTYEESSRGLSITINPVPEGGDLWPRLLLQGEPKDLSQYTHVIFEVVNETGRDQSITVGVSTDPDRSQGQASQVPPGAEVKVRLNIADGSRLEQSSVIYCTVYQHRPMVTQTYLLKRVVAISNPDHVSKRASMQGLMAETERMYELLEAAEGQAKGPMVEAKRLIVAAKKLYEGRRPGYASEMEGHLLMAQQKIMGSAMRSRKERVTLWSSPLGMAIREETLPLPDVEVLTTINERVCLGQYRAIPMNFSTGAQGAKVKVWLETAAEAPVSLKPMLWVKARDRSMTADAVGQPDKEVSWDLPAYRTEQLLIWVDARQGSPQAGRVEGKLMVEVEGEAARQIPLSIDLVDVGLAKNVVGLESSNWAYFFVGGASASRGLEREIRDNLRDYGMDTWNLDYTQVPYPKVDAEGRYAGFEKESEEKFRQVLELLKGNTEEYFVIWLGFQRQDFKALFEKPGVLEGYFEDLTAVLDEYQVGADRRYLMFWDEPKIPEVRETIAWMKRVNALGYRYQLYEDSTVVFDNDEEMKAYTELCGLWFPNWDQLFLGRPDAVPRALKFRSEKMGFYRCLMSRSNRGVNIYEYYRLMAWHAMTHGFNKIAFWVHNVGPEDPWDGTTGSSSGGMVIYPRDGKLYLSRRWELFRETLDDYRLAQAVFGQNILNAAFNPDLKRFVDQVTGNPDNARVADQVREELINLALSRREKRLQAGDAR